MTRGLDRWEGRVRDAVTAGDPPTPSAIAALVADEETTLGERGALAERRRLSNALLGAGDLAGLLADPSVTDVLVNGDGRVWVDRGLGVVRSPVTLLADEVRPLAVRLAALAGRRLDDAQPWVDGLLPDGVRLHAVLPPLAAGGAHVSLRIPRAAPDSLDALVALGSVCPALARALGAIIEQRRSFLVCGGTGSGKTTLLGGLLAACPDAERIVLVEDVRELEPRHPHVVRLQGRPANVEGTGLVTMTDLVRQALRMRPDRIVVGEVRGAEVRELLAALNTGHEGSGGTVHANAAAEVPARLQALGALAGLGREAVNVQVSSAVEFVVGMRRESRRRRVVEIGVIARQETGEITVDRVVASPTPGVLRPGPAWDRWAGRLGLGDSPRERRGAT